VRAMAERSYARFLPEPGSADTDRPHRNGLASSVRITLHNGRTDASFDDPAWDHDDGFRWSFWALGGRGSGPLVLVVDASAGAPTVPPMTFATDHLRLVLAGSCDIGGRTYAAGDLRVQDARIPVGPETAGPEGCRQVVVFARADAAAPRLDGPADVRSITGPYAALASGVELLDVRAPAGRT
jgi:hypothetical protein